MKKEITISRLGEYIEEILVLHEALHLNLHCDEKLLFRGQGDESFQLLPSLGRLSKDLPCESMFKLEKRLIENAQAKFPAQFCNEKYPINLLAKLQHYGIPTRLLDITSNPLTALYFACKDHPEKDGEVFVFKTNDDCNSSFFPVVNAIADSYKFLFEACTNLEYFYADVSRQPYFKEQIPGIHFSRRDKQETPRNWIEERCDRPLFVNALELNSRQKMQRSKFIIFPNEIIGDTGNRHFSGRISPMAKESPSIEHRFLIVKESKRSILRQLSALGISEGTLFADNIDIVCREITERQKERLVDPDLEM